MHVIRKAPKDNTPESIRKPKKLGNKNGPSLCEAMGMAGSRKNYDKYIALLVSSSVS